MSQALIDAARRLAMGPYKPLSEEVVAVDLRNFVLLRRAVLAHDAASAVNAKPCSMCYGKSTVPRTVERFKDGRWVKEERAVPCPACDGTGRDTTPQPAPQAGSESTS